MTRRVAITGVGVTSAFGRGVDALATGLREGRHALGPLSAFPLTSLGPALTAELREPVDEPPGFEDDRKSALALEAARAALLDADLQAPLAAGVWLGTGLSSCTPRELEEDAFPYLAGSGFDEAAVIGDIARDRVAPRRHLPERATEAVVALGLEGPAATSFSACAAGAQALGLAARAVRRGDVQVALGGAHDAMIHPLGVLSFAALGALSEDRCRPFDRRRDGFTIGEGSAVLVLEDEDHARARGARVLGWLLGCGTSVDAWNLTAPHPEGRGAALSMRRALRDAGLGPEAVSHVNAHGTGTPLGDAAEARAVLDVLGPQVPVASIKGAIGHCIAAAGAVEAAAIVAGLSQGWSAGTAGLEEDDALGITLQRSPREDRPSVVLSNSFGFGGQNCTLLFGAP